jgi:hypothetical protein
MNPATEILLSAAFALTPEENWTKEALGRTATGAPVWESDEDAVCWCLLGAFQLVRKDSGMDDTAYYDAKDYFEKACGQGLVNFNNTHTHAEVLDALYRAAEIAEERNG